MPKRQKYDVVIIGGGHAGSEAAWFCSQMQKKTILVTHNLETIGEMSCNPAVGGIGKSQLVKEIDAMGGVMPRAIDNSGIHFRKLNSSRGPAVRATRAQADRSLYKKEVRMALEGQEYLDFCAMEATEIMVDDGRVVGVRLDFDQEILAQAVIITAGTFLNGKIHVGRENKHGGRIGELNAKRLSENIKDFGFRVRRLKTGTPPRVDGRSINFESMVKQTGDVPIPWFSVYNRPAIVLPQIDCYITRTNERTHEIIRNNLDKSPLYQGLIEGIGPRYCPSIEDKVVRFAGRDSHQVFLEREGLKTNEYYPNGLSTSLPLDLQLAILQSIKGMEGVKIIKPGYAIEYDFFDPRDLNESLETKSIKGLFFAGQINGTTGYEEAAAQGCIAGINAVLSIDELDMWCPVRSEAYMGVMVDDLVTKGTNDPYRMFTSRAEYRLILREDNADARLTQVARNFGLIEDNRWRKFEIRQENIANETARLKSTTLRKGHLESATISELLGAGNYKGQSLFDLLKQKDLKYKSLMNLKEMGPWIQDSEEIEQIEIAAHYEGYIKKQMLEIEKLKKSENKRIDASINYADVYGLSNEVVEKFENIRPRTVGQASRIPGITPAAISILLIHLKKGESSLVNRQQ